MNVLLTQTISTWGWLTLLAARNSEGEDTFWGQLLVVVILAVSFGIYSLARAKANESKVEDLPQHKRELAGKTFKLPGAAKAKSEGLRKERAKDLQSGMEVLDSDFLLSIVEKTNGGDDDKDVAMRKLNFKELLRRGKLSQADSKALKTYAINKGNLYGKDIQCEALKKLAERTAKGKTGN
ncbi:MAG: hypothetical protein PHQ35_05735 [Phycisphaerae bacterium]|nr:hypothetical protein [Phycisphaerae bacterium]MDD5381317.1 hypothetical protein [Phycisphaerae bacterium]